MMLFMSKLSKNKKICISITSILVIVCISVIGYLRYKDTIDTKKELPYIEDVKNYKDYSKEDLEDILFKSEYPEIGRFIQNLSASEQKDLKKYCPYIDDNSRVTVYYNNTGSSKEKTASYKTTIYDYAIASAKREADTMSDNNSTASAQTEDTEVDVSSEVASLYAAEGGFTNHNYDYYLDKAKDASSYKDYVEAVGEPTFISSRSTSFFLSFVSMGDNIISSADSGDDTKSLITTGLTSKRYNNLIKPSPKVTNASVSNYNNLNKTNMQKTLRQAVKDPDNQVKITVKLKHADKDTDFIHYKRSAVEKYGDIIVNEIALTGTAAENNYGIVLHPEKAYSQQLYYDTNTTKSTNPENPNAEGDNIKGNNQVILRLHLDYAVPYNLIPATSASYDTSALGRFAFTQWTSSTLSGFYEYDNGYTYFQPGVNTLGFKKTKEMNAYFNDMEHQMDAKLKRMKATYEYEDSSNTTTTITKNVYGWTKENGNEINDICYMQINLGTNSSASEKRQMTYAYWDAHRNDTDFKKKIKDAYENNVDYEKIKDWLLGCKDDKDFNYQTPTKAIILAPAYNALRFNTNKGFVKMPVQDYAYMGKDSEGNDSWTNTMLYENFGYNYEEYDPLGIGATGSQLDISKSLFEKKLSIDFGDATTMDVRTSFVRRGYLLDKIWFENKGNYSSGSLRYDITSADKNKTLISQKYSDDALESKGRRLIYSKSSTENSMMNIVYQELLNKTGREKEVADKQSHNILNYFYDYATIYGKPGSEYYDKSYTNLGLTWSNNKPAIKYDTTKVSNTASDTPDAVYSTAENTITINVKGKAGANTVDTLYSYLKDILYVTDTEDETNDNSDDGLKLNPQIPALNTYSITEVSNDFTIPKWENISSETTPVAPDKIFIRKATTDTYDATIPALKENEEKTFTFTLSTYDYAGAETANPITVYMKITGGPEETPTPAPSQTPLPPPPSQTPTPPTPTPPTPTHSTASGNYHTGHNFTESELKSLVGTGAEKYAYTKKDTYTIPSQYLNKRLAVGTTFTVRRTTTWTHTHVSSCQCTGSDRYVPPSGWVSPTYDENGNRTGGGYYMYSGYWTGCGTTYCRCTYSATLPTEIKEFTVKIGNCSPDMAVRENVPTKTEKGKTVLVADLTEKDTLAWSHIIKLVTKDPCDHEDTRKHSGSGTSCSVCSSSTTSTYNKTTWQDIRNATNSGSKYTFSFAGTSGASGKNATLVVDIGKLVIEKHNPGGTYDIIFTLTDADGAVCTKTAKIYIDWTAPEINVNKDFSVNGLIYHTNDRIPQLDFYTDKVITKAYDYMDIDAVEGDKPLGLAAGNKISSNLLTLKDSDGYPKYIKILDTKTLYVKMKGSDDVCNIKDTEQQAPAENWRAANSVVSEKVFEVSIRCYNPRNSDYYTDVEGIQVKVVNDAPTVGMGDHLLVLYEEWTEDLIVDFPSTMAWDYEDGTIEDKDAQNITYGTETFTSKDGTQRVRKGIEKTSACLIPNGTYLPNGDSTENTADGKANYNVRSTGDPFRLRFKIIDWGGKDVFVAANGYTYFNTNYEGRFKCTMRFYDLDGAYADRDFWVEVRKTEAQKQPHLRFINKYFFYQDEAFGGLASDSIWRTNPEYYNELKTSLETDVTNSDESNNWAGCQRVYIYTADDIKEAKEIIKKHTVNKGAGNGTMDFNEEFIEFMNKHRVK